jgi:hypothetical protein
MVHDALAGACRQKDRAEKRPLVAAESLRETFCPADVYPRPKERAAPQLDHREAEEGLQALELQVRRAGLRLGIEDVDAESGDGGGELFTDREDTKAGRRGVEDDEGPHGDPTTPLLETDQVVRDLDLQVGHEQARQQVEMGVAGIHGRDLPMAARLSRAPT